MLHNRDSIMHCSDIASTRYAGAGIIIMPGRHSCYCTSASNNDYAALVLLYALLLLLLLCQHAVLCYPTADAVSMVHSNRRIYG